MLICCLHITILVASGGCQRVLLYYSRYSFEYVFFLFKQKTAYELRISDWSSDVCSSDLLVPPADLSAVAALRGRPRHRKIHPSQSAPPQIGRASCRERVCQYV